MEDNLIKKFRKRAGYSQKELADALHVSPSAISSWEAGRFSPDKQNLASMADLFGVSVDALIGRQTKIDSIPWRQIDIKPELVAEDEIMIPVVASLRCGFNSAGEPIVFTEKKPVPVSWTRRWGKNIVFIDSVGDSMIPTIRPGDLCVCVPGDAWEDGNIVVADINDSDTIKRIKRTEDGGIDLIPDNKDFEKMHYTPEDCERFQVRILGRIVKVIGPDL